MFVTCSHHFIWTYHASMQAAATVFGEMTQRRRRAAWPCWTRWCEFGLKNRGISSFIRSPFICIPALAFSVFPCCAAVATLICRRTSAHNNTSGQQWRPLTKRSLTLLANVGTSDIWRRRFNTFAEAHPCGFGQVEDLPSATVAVSTASASSTGNLENIVFSPSHQCQPACQQKKKIENIDVLHWVFGLSRNVRSFVVFF